MKPVPSEYVGLWRRERLARPDGWRDVTTEVYWLQSHGLFVDLRIPQPRPDFRGCAGLENLPPELAAWLPRQQGFAGRLTVDDGVCHWHRELDYQPPGEFEDIGRAEFISDALMLESGILADYTEVWRKAVPNGSGALAMRAEKTPGGRVGILVAVGDYFMYAVDRPQALSRESGHADWTAAELECEIGFGRVRPGMPWRIERCSLPFREGGVLLDGFDTRPEQGAIWSPPEDCVLAKAGSHWRVVECTADFRGTPIDGD